MGQSLFTRHSAAAFILLGAVFLAGCQQGAAPNAADVGVQGNTRQEPIRESELRAYCPRVGLREGTSSFRSYEQGAQGNPDNVIYQASIADVTRACKYNEGSTTMTVAVAGKVVPGPKGRTGTITMPIRVVAVRGEEVLYSQLFRHSVTVEDTSGATQFVFTDSNVVIPGDVNRAVRLMVGYDEGPYDTQ